MKIYTWCILAVFLTTATADIAENPDTHISDQIVDPLTSVEYCPQFISDNISLAFEGEWLVEFYAPWCPACQGFESIWEQVAIHFNQPHKSAKVAKVDVTLEPLIASHFMVTALPTIFHINDGEVRIYKSMKRSVTSIVQYITDKEWVDTPEVPYYFRPYSAIMTPFAFLIFFAMVTQEQVMIYARGDPFNLAYMGAALMCGCVCFGGVIGLVIYFCCGVAKYQQYVPKKVRDSNEKTGKAKVD